MNTKKNKCDYCNPSHLAIMNTSGDDFQLLHEPGERWRLAVNTRNDIRILKIRHCPMCGRKLKKSD